MIPFVFFAFGLIIGSFLNVLVARWGERSLTGRSACPACGRTIPWHDLVPVFSWLALRARCRACGARISAEYPLVEGAAGIIFLGIGLAPAALIERVLALPIAAVLIAIAAYDLRHMLIPNYWVYAFSGFSLLLSVIANGSGGGYLIEILASGPIVAAPLFGLWFFSGGRWMGFGDVKLALGMGWLLGWQSGLFALVAAFVVGALISVPLLFFSSNVWKRIHKGFTPNAASRIGRMAYTMKSEIPFGPFLILATLIIWLTNLHGFALVELLYFI